MLATADRMANPTGPGDDNRQQPPHQSMSGVTGGSGVTGNIAGNAYNYQNFTLTPSHRDMVDRINARSADEAFGIFDNCEREGIDRITVLHLVRLDKAVDLIIRMRAVKGLQETAAHLQRLDEPHLVDLLAPGHHRVPKHLAAEVLAVLVPMTSQHVLAKLGGTEPEHAADLVERVAALKAHPRARSGPIGAVQVLPSDPADRRFLTNLSASAATAGLLANLPNRNELRALLAQKTADSLTSLLTVAASEYLIPLLEALPKDRAVEQLNALGRLQVAHFFASAYASLSVPIANKMRPDKLAAAMPSDPIEAVLLLEAMSRVKAASLLTAMEPSRAGACLEQVHVASAVDLLQGMASSPGAELQAILKAMSPWLVAGLLAVIAADRPDIANRLRTALPIGWTAPTTGWPHLDAARVLLAVTRPGLRRLTSRFRGSTSIGVALLRQLQDARLLWQGTRRSTAGLPVDYRQQRNHLGIALALALVALAGLTLRVVTQQATSTQPTKSQPSTVRQPVAQPSTSLSGLAATNRREHAGLPAVTVYRAGWSDRDCPRWTQDDSMVMDSRSWTAVDGLLRLTCDLQTSRGVQLALVWYPPANPPDGDRFTGRPTTVGAFKVVTPGRSPSDWPTWSMTVAGDRRHGTYLRYFPDKGRAAIWLEDTQNGVALILLGPAGAGDRFAQLETILDAHHFQLD